MTRREGARPQPWDMLRHADFSNMPQPLKDAFLAVNPDRGKLRAMHDKDAERMRGFQDVEDKLAAAVRVPALIISGDRDIVRPEHAIEVTRLMPDARLLILPAGHGDYLDDAAAPASTPDYPLWVAGLVGAFLDNGP